MCHGPRAKALVEEDVDDAAAEQPSHLHAPAAAAVDDAELEAFLQAADEAHASGIIIAPAVPGLAQQQQQLQEEEVYEADYDSAAEDESAAPVHEPATPAPAPAPAAEDSLHYELEPAAVVEQHQPQPEPYAAAVLLPSTSQQHPATPKRAVDVAPSSEQLPVARLTSAISSSSSGQHSRLSSSAGHQRQPSGSQWHKVPAASAAAPVHTSILASPARAADGALSSDDEAADWPSPAAQQVAGGHGVQSGSSSTAGSPAAAPKQRPSSASSAVRGSGKNRQQQQQERPPWQDPCAEPQPLPEVLPVAEWSGARAQEECYDVARSSIARCQCSQCLPLTAPC
jgi:hypothetical protein